MTRNKDEVGRLVQNAALDSRGRTRPEPEPDTPREVQWPMNCTVGPGLEGAIACETRIGYVNGAKGYLLYRGYDIFDLCAHSTFEEVAYLLLYGSLPTKPQFEDFRKLLVETRFLPNTLRRLMGVPIEGMHPMAALRLGADFMRQRLTWRDNASARPESEEAIASDEDSIPMETKPRGEDHAIYEFRPRQWTRPQDARKVTDDATGFETCIRLISGLATLAAAIARLREDKLPIEPDPNLSHAANFLYMLTGRRPSPEEARIMDVALILHADHGMNASTFACMVVASTMSDIYFSVGAGIGALNGPLHGGANEQVIKVLNEIGSPANVDAWFDRGRKQGRKIPGFGHRVYKTYDPRARVLGPLAHRLAQKDERVMELYETACALEKKVIETLGQSKGVFPNVDFYSGLVYRSLGIPVELFTPVFAVSRVAGWTARVTEYLQWNRIFRPRALYIGDFGKKYVNIRSRNPAPAPASEERPA